MSSEFWCRGCEKEFPDDSEGIDVNGYGDFLICKGCWWEKLSTFERISLRIMAEPSFDGPGLNVSWAMQSIDEIARKLFRAMHGHDASGICMKCDPGAVKLRLEDRRRKRAEEAKAKNAPVQLPIQQQSD